MPYAEEQRTLEKRTTRTRRNLDPWVTPTGSPSHHHPSKSHHVDHRDHTLSKVLQVSKQSQIGAPAVALVVVVVDEDEF